jgi:hypothetical protein
MSQLTRSAELFGSTGFARRPKVRAGQRFWNHSFPWTGQRRTGENIKSRRSGAAERAVGARMESRIIR